MPGFELKRFAERGASAKELLTMTCFICQDVYCNPLVTKCCKQIFCETCIKSYVVCNPVCPLDSKPLKMTDMDQPPPELTQKLNCKKIRCSFCEKGCKEILTVEQIQNHEKYCIFNMVLCNICNFVATADHQCLKALMELKQNMSTIVDKLRQELDDIDRSNILLQTQIDNYAKTIKDLAMERSKQLEAKSSSQRKKSKTASTITPILFGNKELILEARKYLNTPSVDGRRTRRDMVEKVVEVTKDAIATKDRIYDVSKQIKDFLESRYLGDWNVYVWHSGVGYNFHNSVSDGLIEIKFGKVWFTIYKTYDPLGYNRLLNQIKSGRFRNFGISRSGFEPSATDEIEKSVIDIVKACADVNEFANKMSNELTINYGGVWHCLLYKANFAFFCVRAEKGRFCLLSSSDVRILIFQ